MSASGFFSRSREHEDEAAQERRAAGDRRDRRDVPGLDGVVSTVNADAIAEVTVAVVARAASLADRREPERRTDPDADHAGTS